jgi:uncharacterized protein YbaA (DUF1428 family)
MAKYVDGFLVPVPKKNLAAYRKLSNLAKKVWMEHGALQYVECAGDDLEIAKVASFPKLAKTKPGETVVFSWIMYKSKAHRNSVNKKVMTDPRIAKMMTTPSPFDPKRMAYGGFTVIVEA